MPYNCSGIPPKIRRQISRTQIPIPMNTFKRISLYLVVSAIIIALYTFSVKYDMAFYILANMFALFEIFCIGLVIVLFALFDTNKVSRSDKAAREFGAMKRLSDSLGMFIISSDIAISIAVTVFLLANNYIFSGILLTVYAGLLFLNILQRKEFNRSNTKKEANINPEKI
jgi:hypothetical protein